MTVDGFFEATTKHVTSMELASLRQKHKASAVEDELKEFRAEIEHKYKEQTLTKGFVFPKKNEVQDAKRMKQLEIRLIKDSDLAAV